VVCKIVAAGMFFFGGGQCGAVASEGEKDQRRREMQANIVHLCHYLKLLFTILNNYK
jgi:hypothetical protein